MQQFLNGTNTEFKRDTVGDAPLTAREEWDLNSVLSLADVRAHTKTDDVPSVTDFQLKLYRKAAFEEAQQYTGLMLVGQRIITEDVRPPEPMSYARMQGGMHFVHTTQYATAQNFVWYYGLKSQKPQRVAVPIGTNEVKLPRQFDDFGLGCCNPCGSAAHARIQYVAGFGCEADLPAVLLLGVLKYIAHVVENPGDFVVMQGVGGGKKTGGDIAAAANPAWASGAIELWRTLKRDAI